MKRLKVFLVLVIILGFSISVEGQNVWGQAQRGVEIKGVVVSGIKGAETVASSSSLSDSRHVQFGETLPRGKEIAIQAGGRTEFLVDSTSVITAEEQSKFILRRESLSEPAVLVQQGRIALAVSQKLKKKDNWVHIHTPSFVAKTKGGLIDVEIQKPSSHANPINQPPFPHIVPTSYRADVASNEEALIETLHVREGTVFLSFHGRTKPLTLGVGETLRLINGEPAPPSSEPFRIERKAPLAAIVSHHRSPEGIQEKMWNTEMQQAANLGKTVFGAQEQESENQAIGEEQVVLATTAGNLSNGQNADSGSPPSSPLPSLADNFNRDSSFDSSFPSPLTPSPPPGTVNPKPTIPNIGTANPGIDFDQGLAINDPVFTPNPGGGTEPASFVSVLDVSSASSTPLFFSPTIFTGNPVKGGKPPLPAPLVALNQKDILVPTSSPPGIFSLAKEASTVVQVFKTELTAPNNFSLIALLNAKLGEAQQSSRNAILVQVEQNDIDSNIDSALLTATKPLVSLLENSSMTTTGDSILVRGRTAQNESATISANLMPGDALIQVASNSTLNVGGNLVNLTNGGALNITGHLASLTQNSTLNVAGALVSLSGVSTFSLTGGSLLAFGPGANTASFTNTLCAAGCQNISGIPVALSGGALSSQVQVSPTFVPFAGVGDFANATNQLNLNNGQAAILEVTGPQATVQLGL